MVIFKGKHLKSEWYVGASTGTFVCVSDNGWITSEQYVRKNLPKDDTRGHLLLVDGHGSHVFNLSFLQLMNENNIHPIPICFPPHTTHWLQPADRTFFQQPQTWLDGSWSFFHYGEEKRRKATRQEAVFTCSYSLGQRLQVSKLLSWVSEWLECSLLIHSTHHYSKLLLLEGFNAILAQSWASERPNVKN